MGKKKKAEQSVFKTSVKSLSGDIDAEKQKMSDYSKKMGSSVRSLQNGFKEHSKDMKAAALKMNEEGTTRMRGKVNKFKAEIQEGTTRMRGKVNKFKAEIRGQFKENKEAASRIGSSVKILLNEVNKKQGSFQNYIKAFWG